MIQKLPGRGSKLKCVTDFGIQGVKWPCWDNLIVLCVLRAWPSVYLLSTSSQEVAQQQQAFQNKYSVAHDFVQFNPECMDDSVLLMISAPPCLGLSWNTVGLLKQAGIQLSHSQHSRGGHSAFLPNLSVQELTEQVKMWKKSELIIWASKWANEWVTNEEGLQLSWVNEWSCRALSKSPGVIKKKYLVLLSQAPYFAP